MSKKILKKDFIGSLDRLEEALEREANDPDAWVKEVDKRAGDVHRESATFDFYPDPVKLVRTRVIPILDLAYTLIDRLKGDYTQYLMKMEARICRIASMYPIQLHA